MRVRITNGVRAEKNGELQHLEVGEVHDLDREIAQLLINQGQAEKTDDKITTRDPKRAAA